MSIHDPVMDASASAASSPQPPYPLHPSVADKLDPQYVAFYNKHIVNAQQVHYQPVAASRVGGKIIPGGSDILPVGKTQDVSIVRRETSGPDVKARCFVPEGEAPAAGWPAMIYYHGGGWVLGNIDTENTVCTNMCKRARCVVITTDYRLAPEDPFPAAVHDSWEALLWTITDGERILHLDISSLAIGGSSAGGNLAAVMTQKLLARSDLSGTRFKTQLLIVPVTDNTADVANNATYASCEHTAALPAEKMLWYRKHYLPDESTWASAEASPLLTDASTFSQLPPATILVGELDVLRWEGEEYARKLQASGVKAKVELMKGMPHPFLAMDAVLDEGARAISILCDELTETFSDNASMAD